MKSKNQARSRIRVILFNLVFCVLVVIGLIISLKVANIVILHTTTDPKIPVDKLACSRTAPYPIPAEFSRAISIIEQRIGVDFMGDLKNCLNIQYKDLKTEGSETEGVFLFDNSISSPNNLVIFVDSSYKDQDDYLTAILLVHEITHAVQFYNSSTKSCVDKEVQAHFNEFILSAKLNQGERNSLSARMYNLLDYPSSSPQIRALESLTDIFLAANKTCNGQTQCSLDEAKVLIGKMIIDSPFYQKQCGL